MQVNFFPRENLKTYWHWNASQLSVNTPPALSDALKCSWSKDLKRDQKKKKKEVFDLWSLESPWARLNCSLVRPSISVGALHRNAQETHGKLLSTYSWSYQGKDSWGQLINFSSQFLPASVKQAGFAMLPPVCTNQDLLLELFPPQASDGIGIIK